MEVPAGASRSLRMKVTQNLGYQVCILISDEITDKSVRGRQDQRVVGNRGGEGLDPGVELLVWESAL